MLIFTKAPAIQTVSTKLRRETSGSDFRGAKIAIISYFVFGPDFLASPPAFFIAALMKATKIG